MDPLQTSFIPKEGVGIAEKVRKARKRPNGAFGVITIFVLVLMVAAFVGLSIYQQVLVEENQGLRESIEIAQKSFESDDMDLEGEHDIDVGDFEDLDFDENWN